jgi:hypothetical protein
MKKSGFSAVISFLVILGVVYGVAAAGEEMFSKTVNSADLLPPELTLKTSGLTVSLSWTAVVGATGYTLYYAPYPYTGPDSIGSIPMGENRSMTATLWDGAAFYVAISAYNGNETSGYSNIEYFDLKSEPSKFPVPDTGQTLCSNGLNEIACPMPGEAFYGQDACYRINPMSYTKMDAAGNPLPDEASVWSMVRDNVTGLIWEGKTGDGSIHDRGNTYDWTDSQEVFIKTLNRMAFGGYTDWRMPTVPELACILNYGTCDPAINSGFFPNTWSSRYWSSTANAGNSGQAWAVDAGMGYDSHYTAVTEHCHARAVRGEQTSHPLVDDQDGTVTDTATGLMWQKETAPGAFSWNEALAYCENLTLAGHEDWRLPTIKELRSLVRYDTFDPSIDSEFFTDTVSSYYWSATSNVTCRGGGVWYIHFSYGYSSDFYNESNSYHVRAVRGVNR